MAQSGIGPLQAQILEYVKANPGCSLNAATRWHGHGMTAQRSAYALEERGLLVIDRGRLVYALYTREDHEDLAERIDQARENAVALDRLQRQAEREPDLLNRMDLIDAMGGLVRAQIEAFKAGGAGR